MNSSPTAPRSRPRRTALTAALTCVAMIATTAVANAWPMQGSNPANTQQAQAVGPTDPGLKWVADSRDLTTASAPDGYTMGAEVSTEAWNAPIVANGLVIRRGWNDDADQAAMIAFNANNGELAWVVEDVAARCAAAVDSTGRLWTLRPASADEDQTTPFLEAFNAQGQAIAGTQFPLDASVPSNTYCDGSSLHLGGSGENERIVLLPRNRGENDLVVVDISGPTPSLAWVVDGNDSPPFDEIVKDSPGNIGTGEARVLAFSNESVYLPILTDGSFQLIEMALADGMETNRVDLDLIGPDGEQTIDLTWLLGAQVMLHQGYAMVTGMFFSGSNQATINGVLLSGTWDEPAWVEFHDARGGPTRMAASGSTVVYNAGTGRLYGYDLSSTTPTSWSGDIDVVELGAIGRFDVTTDSAGNIYTLRQPGIQDAVRIVRLSPTGQQAWAIPRTGLEAAVDVQAGQALRLGPIGPDGTIYAYRQDVMFAIDGSGGLAEEDQCQLPFTDVPESSVHAANICRLVELEVTGGTTTTTYSPTQNVTRAQMATFLTRALGLPAGTGQQFPDVDPSSVHARSILSIRDAGITQGRADGTYDPNGTVTRAEMASFLARASGLDGVQGTGFTDVNPSNVHTPNIYAVRDADITTGVTPTTFDPDGNVRRDQMASFLIRMIDFIDEG